jgi:hypothetical protein
MVYKKQISILVAFFLLLSNTGMALNVHFCADVIASISFHSAGDEQQIEANCCGSAEKESHCCDNKIIKSDKNSDQILLKSFVFEVSEFLLNASIKAIFQETAINFKKAVATNFCCNANAPPIYKRNCQLVFYA